LYNDRTLSLNYLLAMHVDYCSIPTLEEQEQLASVVRAGCSCAGMCMQSCQ